ncbi:MAG: SGNH/GDSL hydrolase family protein [Deltaproteobacteria bacterium]|nr:SGNH/GDSL hydrolase family protein [Deltaproteobacteria bacterium]
MRVAANGAEGDVTRTILFFGDSNTRGYGVGREHRYAAHVEAALAPAMGADWRFAVSGADSDFRVIPERLYRAVAKHRPDILVWQCPTGPAAHFVQYPPWLRPLRAAYNTLFRWRRELGIRVEQVRAEPALSSRRDVLYDGLYVDALYRWRPAAWPGTRHVNGWLAARYGVVVKATRERYLELIERHRERLRVESGARLLFLGLVPHSDYMYPGYGARVTAWSRDLAALLHHPEDGSVYVDLYTPLAAHPRRHLLHDGAHLAADGHRRVAELVIPALLPLMRACERAA